MSDKRTQLWNALEHGQNHVSAEKKAAFSAAIKRMQGAGKLSIPLCGLYLLVQRRPSWLKLVVFPGNGQTHDPRLPVLLECHCE